MYNNDGVVVVFTGTHARFLLCNSESRLYGISVSRHTIHMVVWYHTYLHNQTVFLCIHTREEQTEISLTLSHSLLGTTDVLDTMND